jgi:hypothetical protein
LDVLPTAEVVYDCGMDDGANTEQITEARKRSLANLRPPWKPGESGHKAGRPKRSLGEIVVTRMLKARVPEDPENRRMVELITRALCAKAIKGDTDAARLLFERAYGRVALEAEFEPITQINVIIRKNVPHTIESGAPPLIEGK